MKESTKSVAKVLSLFAVAFALMVAILFLLKREMLAALAVLVVEVVVVGTAVVEADKIKTRRARQADEDQGSR